ncbi:MAG: prephenate/arogenate dehydrogenase family protein [Pseudomonadota bacterium]
MSAGPPDPAPPAPFERLALVGLGLIGSSVAHAARRSGAAREIVGFARSEATRATARRLGFCDHVSESAADAVKGADCVIVSVPVGASGAVAREVAPALAPGAILTDVGSVKAEVVAAMAPHVPPGVHFVPGHPLAGTEHSGPEAGFAELFENRWVILTPAEGDPPAPVARLSGFWRALGALVTEMTPEHHDLVLAVTSHVPHAIAYTMVGVADDLARVTDSEVVKFSAAGFRDFTRIAASDPVMWRDVFLNNREATLDILGRFTEELYELRRAIRTGDGPWLEAYFTRTRAVRRSIIEAGQDTAAPNFGRAPSASGERAGTDTASSARRRPDDRSGSATLPPSAADTEPLSVPADTRRAAQKG